MRTLEKLQGGLLVAIILCASFLAVIAYAYVSVQKIFVTIYLQSYSSCPRFGTFTIQDGNRTEILTGGYGKYQFTGNDITLAFSPPVGCTVTHATVAVGSVLHSQVLTMNRTGDAWSVRLHLNNGVYSFEAMGIVE